jgi:hypothetical protein
METNKDYKIYAKIRPQDEDQKMISFKPDNEISIQNPLSEGEVQRHNFYFDKTFD